MKRSDYKQISKHHTFGNDKLISNSKFKPSFAIAEGVCTEILQLPTKEFELCLIKYTNSDENVEKMRFLECYQWFNEFTQLRKTKLVNRMVKKSYLPGQTVVKEGEVHSYIYAIIKGTCNLVCMQNTDKFMSIAISEDPTQLKRYKEQKQLMNPNMTSRMQDKSKRTKFQASQAKLIQQNGFISSTLKHINICQKSDKQWLCEELLEMKPTNPTTFLYSIIAQTKCDVFQIHIQDLVILPTQFKNELISLARIRSNQLLSKTIDHYQSLKCIKEGIDT